MAKKDSGFTPMSDLMEEKKKLEKKMKRITIPCSHTNSNGKVKIDFIGKGNLVRCKKCGCKFDFGVIESDDLRSAIRTVHNAINQIKAMTDDPEKEVTVIKNLGELDYNLDAMEELYSKTVYQYNKGGAKKKKKHTNNEYGSYGAGSIDFIGGGKRKNRYY